MKSLKVGILALGMAVAFAACSSAQSPTPSDSTPSNSEIANPASEYCEEQGGTLEIRTDSSGGQYGVCLFDDGSECEEWAFFRGECQPGEEDNLTMLEGNTWQWVSLVEMEPAAQSVVPSPENYTLTFLPDGEVSIQADCNMVVGSYTLDGHQLTITQGASTMAFCGEESLDLQYLELISRVESNTLENGQLVLELKDGAGRVTFEESSMEPDMGLEADVVGIIWLWTRFDDTAGLNDIEVDDPSRYTLLLNQDGTYEVQADCNRASGRYTLEVSSITFESGPTTLAECEPGSLYDIFLTRLSEVATFVMDEGQLVLNLWADGGNMVFSPAE